MRRTNLGSRGGARRLWSGGRTARSRGLDRGVRVFSVKSAVVRASTVRPGASIAVFVRRSPSTEPRRRVDGGDDTVGSSVPISGRAREVPYGVRTPRASVTFYLCVAVRRAGAAGRKRGSERERERKKEIKIKVSGRETGRCVRGSACEYWVARRGRAKFRRGAEEGAPAVPSSVECELDDGLKIVLPPDNMSDGVDGGGGENEVDSHSSSQAEAGDSSNHREEEALDPDNEAALNTNYDSSDGAVPAFRCDRCDNYETINKTAFSAHQDQCLASGEAGESTEGIEGTENDGDGEEGHSGIRSHRKMFECDVCNMKFSNGANMRRHKMRHTGVKPYECRVCQKRFFRKDHLAEHFTTHSKTLPYHCPICNRGFQRQIAMRAHFQNEHVGQHDMVKSCPLCNYRAATMKCLRLHFFNRHGIDLDNPGPNSSTSIMNSCTSGEAMPSAPLSDSGDSTGNRSTDNATPPMHFLTPHVEISIPYPEQAANQRNSSPAPLNGDSPNSPQSADSNSNAPSSSHHQLSINSSTIHRNVGGGDEAITPSISLIPIKQEPNSNGMDDGATSSNLPLPSLIKVSPLKSLLRDDLRRKLSTSSTNNNNNSSNNSGCGGGVNSNPHSRGEPPTSTRPDPRTSGLQCTHCRITFPDQTLYFLHKGCHSESNPWKCNICGEQCCNLYQFNSHLLSKSHQ